MAALDRRHAVVTGGGRGIGRAIAAALTAGGDAVTIIGRGERALIDAVKSGQAMAYAVADVTDEQALTQALQQAASARGPVGILVANAGGADSAPFLKTSPDQFRRMFDLNVVGVVNSVRAVLADMIARKFGRIVAVASTAGLKGYAYVSAYCAAKHAVVGLVRALAIEIADTGVTVNAVCPGYTETDMTHESLRCIAEKTGRSREDALAALLKDVPLKRLVRPEEVAAAVSYLCSAEAAAVNGATLAVAGGEI
jgi:NAD(P)-dependent dehydrogenase (short-subunit alcohol dehydrogenase family)